MERADWLTAPPDEDLRESGEQRFTIHSQPESKRLNLYYRPDILTAATLLNTYDLPTPCNLQPTTYQWTNHAAFETRRLFSSIISFPFFSHYPILG